MRAIRYDSFGGPDVLRLVELERPVPGPGEVLVRIRAAGVNPVDWKLRRNILNIWGNPPMVPGVDLSGEIAELGPGVTGFRVGDEVFAALFGANGTYAEYAVVPTESLALKPAAIDHVTAAALPVAGLTAWQSVIAEAGLQPGQRVLVHAAAGGVGHLAVQFAKVHGAYVIGTASAANHDLVREFGADELIDYSEADFAQVVRNVDVVLDPMGDDYGPRSLEVLRPGGILVAIDGTGTELRVTPEAAADRGLRYKAFYMSPSGTDLGKVGELVASGAARVELAEVLPLEEAARAHELSEGGRVRGKIVLTVA
ncbi:NADP-dependent oxidoreductase [Kitasatospora sp. NPDC054939]